MPYIKGMTRLVLLLAIVFAMIFFWKLNALRSGKALRARSRPMQNDQIEVLFNRLAHAAGIDRVDVRVLDQPMINGLATPSGEIYVTQGLIDAYRGGKITPHEFVSVVAHELGHLALGHTRRRMIDVSAAQAAHILLGGIIARFIPYVGWMIARWLTSAFVATLSRQDEFEADAYATALMVKARLGAEPQARMLEKLEEPAIGGTSVARAGWLASHPPVPERAARIRDNDRRWRAGAEAGESR